MAEPMSRRRRLATSAGETLEASASHLHFTPFKGVSIGRKGQLDIDLVDGGDRRSVSMRVWSSAGRDRPTKPGRPIHVFAEHLPTLIAALTEAAAAVGALPDDWPTLPSSASHGSRQWPAGNRSSDHSGPA